MNCIWSRSYFTTTETRCSPDKIYIYTQKPGAAEMLVVPERTVLFCMGKVHTRNTENDGQVFQVIDETSPFTLLNEIQRIFDYYDRWGEAPSGADTTG